MRLSRRDFVVLSGLLAMSQTACSWIPGEQNDSVVVGDNNLLRVSDTHLFNSNVNAAWCASFQLVWDAMLNMLRGGEALSDDGNLSVKSLDTAQFHGESLSYNDYYVYSGHPELDAKTNIEETLQMKFDQSSDFLDELEWYETGSEGALSHWLLYCMLYTKFDFHIPFTVHEHESFGSDETGNFTEDVTYFGYFLEESEPQICEHMLPLFWLSDNCCGVQLNSKGPNTCFVVRGCEGSTFSEVWDAAWACKKSMPESVKLIVDNFKMPRLFVDTVMNFEELQGVSVRATQDNDFVRKNDTVEIDAAVQALRFSLNEFGGEVKSEAAIAYTNGMPSTLGEHHNFFFDDDFFVFVTRPDENDKYIPYMALHVYDVSELLPE